MVRQRNGLTHTDVTSVFKVVKGIVPVQTADGCHKLVQLSFHLTGKLDLGGVDILLATTR